MDAIQKSLLEQVADLHEVPEGAYNIRANGQKAARNLSLIHIWDKAPPACRSRPPIRTRRSSPV